MSDGFVVDRFLVIPDEDVLQAVFDEVADGNLPAQRTNQLDRDV